MTSKELKDVVLTPHEEEILQQWMKQHPQYAAQLQRDMQRILDVKPRLPASNERAFIVDSHGVATLQQGQV